MPHANHFAPDPSNLQMDGQDAAIVEQVRAGDVDAFRVLVGRHGRTIFNMAYRMTGNEHDAEDVMQETFLKAYRQLDRFESRAGFGTWVNRIGINCALDLLRTRKSRREVTDSEDSESTMALDSLAATAPLPDAQLHDCEVRERVTEAMDCLTANERAAFVLRHFQDVPIREIGKVLGLKESATKVTIFRAVHKLRQVLEPMMGELR
jgi:RNA polymerase sigma-70 factor, ECF subfamily